MASQSGILGLSIVGSEKGGQLYYAASNTYHVTSHAYTHWRFRDWNYYSDFDTHFFPISESGNPIRSLVGSGVGYLYPSQEHFAWGNVHRQPEKNDFPMEDTYLPYTGYRNYLSTPSKSGYVDLDLSFDLSDHFSLYFHTIGTSGVIFSRGKDVVNGLEFEVVATYEDGTRKIDFNYYDMYNRPGTLTLEPGSYYPERYFIYYSGTISNGFFAIAEISDDTVTWTNSGNISPRRRVSGAKSQLFQNVVPTYYTNSPTFDGRICEFGASTGLWTQAQRLNYIAKCGGDPYNSLVASVPCSADVTWCGQYFPPGTGAINDALYFNLGTNSNFYQFLPLNTAPSSMRAVMCVEHNTNHSGVWLTPWVYFYGGTSIHRTFCNSVFVPSGEKQELVVYPDLSRSSAAFNEPTYNSDITSIFVYCDVTYDNKQGDDYYGDLKVYSFKFEADGWTVAPTGDATLTLYEYGSNSESTGSLDLFIDNKQLNQSLDLFTKAYDVQTEELSLYTTSYLSTTETLPIYTDGKVYSYTDMPLYTEGPTLYATSGVLDLFIWSTTNPTIRSSVPLFTRNDGGDPDPNYALNLYTYGKEGNTTSSMPLYIKYTGYETNNNLNLFLLGPSGYNSNITLFVKAPGTTSTTEEYFPSNASMNLFIARDYETWDKGLDLYLRAPEPVNNNVSMYTYGVAPTTSGIVNLYTYGVGTGNNKVKLYSRGY